MHPIAVLQLYLKHQAIKLNCYCFVLTDLVKGKAIPSLSRKMRSKTPLAIGEYPRNGITDFYIYIYVF